MRNKLYHSQIALRKTIFLLPAILLTLLCAGGAARAAGETVSFSSSSSSGSESSTSVNIGVTLNQSSGSTITVDYAVSGGTATGSGTDYTLASGTLTFNPSDTSENIAVTVEDDSLDEDNETIQMTLSNPVNADLGATTAHTYTINDNDDAPTVTFDISSSSGSESITPVNRTVSLSAQSGLTVTVDYSLGGSATGSGTYYTLASGTLTFTPGQTSKNLSIVVVNDTADEPSETIQITLTNPANSSLGAISTYTYTINDNDDAPTVAFTAGSAGNSEAATTVNLPVSLTVSSGYTVTVDYSATGGTATSGGTDYTLVSGTLTFPPGDTAENISITVINDAVDESDETIQVTLTDPSNAVLGTTDVFTYTVLDNDPTPSVTFSSSSSEGNETTSGVNLTVSLSNPSSSTITVDYASTGGTATGSGTDYTLNSGTLTFSPGDTSETISLTVINDDDDESHETIEVELSNSSNAEVGSPNIHTYTIIDNEDPQTITFSSNSSGGYENVQYPQNLLVTLSAVSALTVTVDYSVTGGSATGGGVDYTLNSGTMTFNPGAQTKKVVPTIVDDSLYEDSETIEVTLSNPSNGLRLYNAVNLKGGQH